MAFARSDFFRPELFFILFSYVVPKDLQIQANIRRIFLRKYVQNKNMSHPHLITRCRKLTGIFTLNNKPHRSLSGGGPLNCWLTVVHFLLTVCRICYGFCPKRPDLSTFTKSKIYWAKEPQLYLFLLFQNLGFIKCSPCLKFF